MPDETKAVELMEDDLESVAGGAGRRSCIVKCSCGWEGPSGLTEKSAIEKAEDHKSNARCAGTITYTYTTC